MPDAPQTIKNHTRLDPGFHLALMPPLLLTFLWAAVNFARHPGSLAGCIAVLAALTILTALKARMYALKVQDRLIRLEERLRLAQLAPESLRHRVPELTESQLIALRFAPDQELPALAGRAIEEKLSNAQIKESIRNWRPDYFRV